MHSHIKFPRLGLLTYIKHSDFAGGSTCSNENHNCAVRCCNSTVSTRALAPTCVKPCSSTLLRSLTPKMTPSYFHPKVPQAMTHLPRANMLAKTRALDSLGFYVPSLFVCPAPSNEFYIPSLKLSFKKLFPRNNTILSIPILHLGKDSNWRQFKSN